MKCEICRKDFATLNKYIIHIEFFHAFINNFKCPIPNCYRRYNQKSSFRKHVNTKHLLSEKARGVHFENTNNIFEFEGGSSTLNFSTKNEILDLNKNKEKISTVPKTNDLRRKALHFNDILQSTVQGFIAKLYTLKSINRTTIQIIIDSVTQFFSSGIIQALKECCDIASKTPEDTTSTEVLTNIFRLIEDPFKNFKTEYKRIQFFEKSNKFVFPESQVVGVSQTSKRKDNKVFMNINNNLCYFLSMAQTLSLFLELPGVFDSILDYQKQVSHMSNITLLNVVNGSLWKQLKVDLDTEIIFPIVVYFDDFEILNPLGSHAGSYKIGVVYYTLPTIPPSYASKLENIFLALIFYSGDRTKFGNDKIFHKVISELNNLQQKGISINVSNKSINVKFVLTTIIGDNLGLNSILGYFESFSSNYYCRICVCLKDEMRTQLQEVKDKFRDINAYEKNVQDKIGLKEECTWNKVKNFHVYKNIYCDVMHDLFEGVHRYDMLLIINQLIKKKYFTLDILNSRLKFATYNNFEKNIPPGFSNDQLKKECIIISASEMLCLVRNFRFIVGDLIPYNDDTWKLYLLIYDITEILTSASIQARTLDYLRELITEHHSLYLKLSESHLKPKYHFLIHYAEVILKIGPPVLLSCMRYEGKHADFKNIAQNVNCRKNVPYSLALKHQLSVCSRFLSNQGFVDSIELGALDNVDEKKI